MFTATRDAAAAQARADGDPATARRIAALKRPTQGAFLVNVLALRRPDVVAELIELGEQINTAQGTVTAAGLRDLTARRRTAIGAALATCRSLAAEAGAGVPTAAQLAEAEATLAAAMADPAAADQVRAGRLVKALTYAGFGAGVGMTATVKAAGARRMASGPATPRPEAVRPPEEPVDTEPTAAEIERQRREEERAAWERLARAEAGFAAAQAQERATNEEMDRIADEITRLRSALDATSQQARTARTARQAAERELAAARRAVGPTG